MIKLLNFYKYNPQLGSNRSLSEEKYELHDSLNRLYTWMKPGFHLMSSSFLGKDYKEYEWTRCHFIF